MSWLPYTRITSLTFVYQSRAYSVSINPSVPLCLHHQPTIPFDHTFNRLCYLLPSPITLITCPSPSLFMTVMRILFTYSPPPVYPYLLALPIYTHITWPSPSSHFITPSSIFVHIFRPPYYYSLITCALWHPRKVSLIWTSVKCPPISVSSRLPRQPVPLLTSNI